MDLFAEETDTDNSKVKPLSFEQYQKLIAQLGKRSKDKDAILPIQIAYFTDLRLGEVAGLIWQDIKLEEQCLTRKQQLKNRMQYGELYHRNFYREVTEKNRVHYEYYNLGMAENVPEDYTKIFFVCLREDGCLELPVTVETARQRQEKYQNWKASISIH